ncbi:hypothetical protein J437_LFUL016266 [Ladona fulva]|uniref:Uncharacterized protein n=1 Tax=Ladona fulva TaxID=123851 RepID=A0A8K0KIL2_LADFU|nr:hypothetical protein J437_LFUL016266 [Ladona fulva]
MVGNSFAMEPSPSCSFDIRKASSGEKITPTRAQKRKSPLMKRFWMQKMSLRMIPFNHRSITHCEQEITDSEVDFGDDNGQYFVGKDKKTKWRIN